MAEVLYDVMNDSFFTSRIVSALGNFVPIVLFVFLAISIKSADKEEKRLKKGFLIIISVFAILSSFNILIEIDDYTNNYFVQQYEAGHYEVISGEVSSLKTENGEILFYIGEEKFVCTSRNFNNRGYHTEDYENNSFIGGDILNVYYVRQDETLESSYQNKVIMKIEKI